MKVSKQIVWGFSGALASFYAQHISGAQRLANGNTLICSGTQGHIFEVTSTGDLVWEYVSPIMGGFISATLGVDASGMPVKGGPVSNNSVFRAQRLAPDFPGLLGKPLFNEGPLTKPAAYTGFGFGGSGIGGGGRYDGLMAQLGGQDLSGIGYGLGVDRTVLALEAEGVTLDGVERRVDVYGVALGAEAKKAMALLINDLRAAGISADMAYGDRGLKGAMKGADRAGARVALVLGENELAAGTVAVKDLAAHTQSDVALDAIVGQLRASLG